MLLLLDEVTLGCCTMLQNANSTVTLSKFILTNKTFSLLLLTLDSGIDVALGIKIAPLLKLFTS